MMVGVEKIGEVELEDFRRYGDGFTLRKSAYTDFHPRDNAMHKSAVYEWPLDKNITLEKAPTFTAGGLRIELIEW